MNLNNKLEIGKEVESIEPYIKDTPRLYTAQQGFDEFALTDETTVNWDLDNQVSRLLATSAVGNSRALTISNSNPGVNYQLTYIQDATGGRALDLSGFDKVYGSIDLTANAESIITVCVTNAGTSFVVVTSDVSVGIDNITEIPNRSYNDLQDLPNRTLKTYNDTDTYSSVLEDNDRFVQVGDTVTNVEIPTGIFSDGDVLVFQAGGNGNPLFAEGDGVSTAVLFLPEGMTYKAKSAGTVYVRMISANSGVLTGDLVKEYEITASPDGTLWKTGQVDNSGNPVAPTAL